MPQLGKKMFSYDKEGMVEYEKAKKVAKKVAKVAPIVVAPIKKAVRISLTQYAKSGKQNASFVFNATGFEFKDFVSDTANKIVKVMELQARIKSKGGKNGAFGLSKSGEFEMAISTATENGTEKLLNNFVFTLGQLGNDAPSEVLVDLIEGFKLLTD